MQKTLADIADFLSADLQGDPNTVINGVGTLQNATSNQIAFLENTKYRPMLRETQAAAVILKSDFMSESPVACLVVANPYHAYARVAELFIRRKTPKSGIHQTAVIGENCQIDESVSIGAHAVIGDGVVLEAGVIIGPGCVIGDECKIGENTRFYANVTLYEEVIVGARCVIHSGVVLGADGFGLANNQGAWYRVPQLGRVILGDDVDVGANTSIDRGAIEDTVIGKGVKLDNLIQIGHNVQIGEHTAMAGCTGVAGSTKIGKHCLIGGASCLTGHIDIADGVFISGMSGVRNSITEPGLYSSNLSVMPDHLWRKNHARLRNLDSIARRVSKLEKLTTDED